MALITAATAKSNVKAAKVKKQSAFQTANPNLMNSINTNISTASNDGRTSYSVSIEKSLDYTILQGMLEDAGYKVTVSETQAMRTLAISWE